MKTRAITVCTAMAALVFGALSAYAGPCAADITRLEHAAHGSAPTTLRPSSRQTISAQLGRQPTRQSVMAAEEQAQTGFEATLARAKAFDAQDQDAECTQAVQDAKLILGLP